MNAVTINEPKLDPLAVPGFYAAKLISWVVKTSWVWLAIFILAPQLGITWLMVLVGIFALHCLQPTDRRLLIAALNRSVETRKRNTTASDNAALRARAAA